MSAGLGFQARARLSALAGLLAFGAGCNAVLGIDEPEKGRLESQDAGNPLTAADSGVGGDDGEGSGASGDGGATLPPVPHTHAWAVWPMPNPAVAGAVNPEMYEAKAQIVTDAVTGLVWQRTVEEAAHSWADAASYCEGLTTSGLKFRLPSRIELLSLVDPTRYNPAIDADAFPEAPADQFWTASPVALDRSVAWAVSFDFSTGFASKVDVTKMLRVRCVQKTDAADQTNAAYSTDTDLVHDMGTKLIWQRAASKKVVTWQAASDACNALSLGGLKGFRLPTIKELETLVDESVTEPAIDQNAFPGTGKAPYWTSTSLVAFDGKSWTVNFADGSDGWTDRTAANFVRCVK